MSSPSSSSSSFDSLFSEHDDATTPTAAKRECPLVPGLWVFPSLLPDDIARETLHAVGEDDLFSGGNRDQVMLFEAPESTLTSRPSSLPTYINSLIRVLEESLKCRIPIEAHRVVFHQSLARQVILNLYPPGQGISPHVDLPNRYADGILGCSLIGGCVMRLTKGEEVHQVYMPPRTVYVFTGEARWEWKHGIEGKYDDLVERLAGGQAETLLRDLRVSVTFRWMKEGADLLS
ncbi:hypothetical protein CI109_105937 [Kwoniella shandongensis]|uniref:Uncharacterized protein n=1 Tax=Kwoniella shandongensis TaxID=1734106 RepID=A0A5M6BQG8_9TREE|nr:uncharacterized protein CI109_006633 [Kwoniella shandongensis]KAA5524993.1 hypothetical protein CI109_006633 [Kwoniella shandongensis]